MLRTNMPSLNDPEGVWGPAGLPPVIDAHVHVFPGDIFSAIWKWFDENAWPIRYRMTTHQIFDFLLSHGIQHVEALQYAHKPGIARQLNQYMLQECAAFEGRVTGLATVYPGEKNAETILQEAFDAGAGGIKLHARVQCFDMNADGFQHGETIHFNRYRPDRILYGSDFPNIPYAWDRELKALAKCDIGIDALQRLSGKNAAELFGIQGDNK
jgi:predicted TIM-barrel fold metal-dependent hydrolase